MKAATPQRAERGFNIYTKSLKSIRTMIAEAQANGETETVIGLRAALVSTKEELAETAIAYRSGRFDKYGDTLVVAFVKNHYDADSYRFDPCVSVLVEDDKRGPYLETRVLFCEGTPEENLAQAIEMVATYGGEKFVA